MYTNTPPPPLSNLQCFRLVTGATHQHPGITRKLPLDSLLLLYPDEAVVKDLPETGDKIWFTGTLLGYQHGASGITEAFGIGG